MKWQNKGHEYDEMYTNIEKKKVFYLFGAGDRGKQFVESFKNELCIAGYIDNSQSKHKRVINGYECFYLDEINLNENTGVIITMDQFSLSGAVKQLENNGFIKRKDFFLLDEFISVYFVYKYNKVYFSTISFLPSTVCNLNCRHCLNFNPFAKKFYFRSLDDLINDVDLFFSIVDYIMVFHLSGGEPFLYKQTPDIVEYISSRYSDKIGTFRMVTNGTIVPSDEVLERIARCKIEIKIDDYRDQVPRFNDKFELLNKKLSQFGIKHYAFKVDEWIDLAPEKTDYSSYTEDELIFHRDSCNQSWEELRGGRLYSCNYAAYAMVAGIAGEQDLEETFDLKQVNETNKKELVEFRLGFTQKGYTEFCKKCRGFTPDNSETVPAAVQNEKKSSEIK